MRPGEIPLNWMPATAIRITAATAMTLDCSWGVRALFSRSTPITCIATAAK